MKKILRFILLFLLVNIIIWGLGLGISYFVVKKNDPIIQSREDYAVLNGNRRDGIIYSKTICKDGTEKITFSWQDVKCSYHRIFEDGIYTNEQGVKISEEVYEYMYELDPVWLNGLDIDIYLDQSTYDWVVDLYEHDGKEYRWCRLEDKDPNGNDLYAKTAERIPVETKDGEYECNNSIKYCVIGVGRDSHIYRTEYKDGKCEVPENICELLKDKDVRIRHPENYYKYCIND